MATELKDKLIESSSGKEAETLAVQLHNATQSLSGMIESNSFQVLLQQAVRILTNVRSCQELANLGITQSGTYEIDLDGPDSMAEPSMVFCDFTTNSTEIRHDQQSEIMIEKCQDGDFGCHQTDLSYDVPMDQIRALIDSSECCEQSIRFDCFLAPLLSFGSDHMGFWKDWNGTSRTFFHGTLDSNTPHICQCGKYYIALLRCTSL